MVTSYGFSLPSGPVSVPSFTAYSRPAQPSRRTSDASYPGLLGIDLGLGSSSLPEDLFGHLGAFDPLTPRSDSSSGSSPEQERDASMESEASPDSTSVELECFAERPSQLPSPAFTTYSPSELHEPLGPAYDDSMGAFADLQAILANDPCHGLNSSQPPTRDESSGFDYDSFAASIEQAQDVHHGGISLDDLVNTRVADTKAYPTPRQSHSSLHRQPQPHLAFNFEEYSEARDRSEQRIALHASLAAAPLPSPPASAPTSRASISMPHSLPSLTLPVTSRTLDTAFSSMSSASIFQSAYASSFPSLSVMPNGLGLHDVSSHSILLDAYTRRKESASNASRLPTPPTSQPAFYIPSELPRPRLPVAIPSWSPQARDGVESREPGTSLFA